jgi:small subunit ribosomal protein S8
MMTDPISDMLTRIRNAQKAGKPSVRMPGSNLKRAILSVLKEEGYVAEFADVEAEKGQGPAQQIEVTLKYVGGRPVISEIERVSKPGLRVYTSVEKMPKVRNGLGVAIVSTSQGVMSDAKARAMNIGGELLCRVF